jgi:RNA polymerase sigma-70 factor (ECF subfamily)
MVHCRISFGCGKKFRPRGQGYRIWVGFRSQEIRYYHVTFSELIHLCTMVDRGRTGSTARGYPESQTMPAHLENEQSLIAAAQAGDSTAFVTLLNQYSRHIYRLAVSITGNHHDAEDVLQETSLRAYTALSDFEGNSRFYTWLVRIAVNVALGKLRKRALWKESSIDEPRESENGDYIPLEIESWGENPEKACLNNELQKILAEVIQILDPKSRTIFTLRDVEKFSIEETANLLGLSIPVIKTRLLRSRLKLREELTKYFGRDTRNAMPTGH